MSAESEVYHKPVQNLRIPGYTLDKIQGEYVIPMRSPFKEGHIDHFAVVADDNLGSLDTTPQLVQTSPLHRRVYELHYGRERYIYWSDEFGNLFATVTTKGNNLNDPHISKDPDAPSGFIYWGLQDSDSILRQTSASQVLRSLGVDTEIILRVVEPAVLPLKGQLVSLDEIKTHLVQKVWEENRPLSTDEEARADRRVTRWDIPAISEALKDMTFYITTRGLQVPERLMDLSLDTLTPEDFTSIMEEVFKFVNMRERIRQKQDPSYEPRIFDVKNDDDVFDYFARYLAYELARNYGRMHMFGLRHVFPHLGNISLTGGIYDLDSVEGSVLDLGDRPVTETQLKEEVEYILWGDERHQFAGGVIPLIGLLEERGYIRSSIERGKAAGIFHFNFSLIYIAERRWTENIVRHLEDIGGFFQMFEPEHFQPVEDFYRELLIDQLGWEYRYKHSLDHAIQSLFRSNPDYWAANVEQFLNTHKLGLEVVKAFLEFVGPHVLADLNEKHNREMTVIEERYGHTARVLVGGMLYYPESEKLRDRIPDEITTELSRVKIYGGDKDQVKILERYLLHQLILSHGWNDEAFLQEVANADDLVGLYERIL